MRLNRTGSPAAARPPPRTGVEAPPCCPSCRLKPGHEARRSKHSERRSIARLRRGMRPRRPSVQRWSVWSCAHYRERYDRRLTTFGAANTVRRSISNAWLGEATMQCKSVMTMAIGIFIAATTLSGQSPAPPPAPWRGAGATPCVGTDGGVYQCAPAPRTIAVRAGRLFDSNGGKMLARQVVVVHGERITE